MRSRSPRWVFVLAGLLSVTAWNRAQAAPSLRIDFIAVGQGDAALVTSPTGKRVLIDGGPHEAGPALTAFLRERDPKPLDLVILSHRHADHLGGLPSWCATSARACSWTRPFPHPTPLYESLMRALDERSIPVRQAERGRRIDLGGGAFATLLSPPTPPISRSRSDVNANSVVLRIDYGKIGILFAGDAEAPTERWLLADGAKLGAQVLKVAHHGSRYSSTPAFLRAVHPTIAVMSVGAGNDYGHPAPETLARLEKLGARVLRTDLDGTVTVETDGEQITVRPARGAPRVSELR